MSKNQPFGELGDLVEELLPVATDLVQAVREEGPDAVRGCLLRMLSVEKNMTPETREKLRHTPFGQWGVFAVVLAGMVDPDAGMRQLLGWTDPLLALEGVQQAVSREQHRLREAGVKSDAAATALARQVARQQDNEEGARMLRVVHGGKSA